MWQLIALAGAAQAYGQYQTGKMQEESMKRQAEKQPLAKRL